MKKLTQISAFTLALFAAGASADVLDFENLSLGQIVDDEYINQGITISATNFSGGPNLAVVFDSNAPTGNDPDLGGPFLPGPGNTVIPAADNPHNYLDPGNILILQENFGCDGLFCSVPDDQEGSGSSGQFTVSFDRPVTLHSIDFFDIELGFHSQTNANRIQLFNDTGLITNFYTPNTGDNRWDRLSFEIENVRRIELNIAGSGAWDNLLYTPITPVPVPPMAPLFGAALAGLGVFARRRQSASAAA